MRWTKEGYPVVTIHIWKGKKGWRKRKYLLQPGIVVPVLVQKTKQQPTRAKKTARRPILRAVAS